MSVVRFIRTPTYSEWTRDWGPHSVFHGNRVWGISDPIFNGYPWVPSGPRGRLRGWDEDDAALPHIAPDGFNAFTVTVDPASATAAAGVASLHLYLPWPSPATGGASIRFSCPASAEVSLAVHDVRGRRARGLVSGVLPAGQHTVLWDGLSGSGLPCAGASYRIVLRIDGLSCVRTCTFLR